MFEEDAINAMEELGHRFFVFVNAENEQVAILYARNDGGYGLIEPIVGGDYAKGPGPQQRAADIAGRSGRTPILPIGPGQQPLVDHVTRRSAATSDGRSPAAG